MLSFARILVILGVILIIAGGLFYLLARAGHPVGQAAGQHPD